MSGVGKTNHNDEPYIKLVMSVFLQTDSSRTVRLLATASGDVNRSVWVAHGWPVNDMGGCLNSENVSGSYVVYHKLYALSYIQYIFN